MTHSIGAFVAALALATVLFLLVPGIDLWASGFFYRPDAGFFLGQAWPLRAIYAGVPYIVDAVVIGVPAIFLLSLLRGRPIWRIDGRAAAFLLLSLALGPGLLVNTAFKDHWGRARPAQVAEFGGTKHFTPAVLPTDQCARNCSFPAGHPAMGFYLVSLAFLIPETRRRRTAEATALAAGAVIGIARMAQGGHFLSDVVFSGFLVYATSWTLYHAIVERDVFGTLLRRIGGVCRPSRRFAFASLSIGAAVLFSMLTLDRPLARLFHDTNPMLHAVFEFITQFGLGKGYLIISASLAAAFAIAAWVRRGTELSQLLWVTAYRASFVFAAVALSGLAADLLKVIFGRARPKLLFRDDFFGFTWGATQADYWSFPSGHATTIAAVATALYFLWPRALPAYLVAALLVAASRIIIDAHYLSDVIAGIALGIASTWAARAGLEQLRQAFSDDTSPLLGARRALSDNP